MKRERIYLYNTETREKEEIVPLDGKKIRMYTCGPTVYNFAHIGNFRTYVFEDVLRRTLKFFGFLVEQAMNLTDIDDKTLKGAIDKGISLDAFTAPFKKAFFEDLATLCIEKVEHYPQATDYVAQMIEMIEKLMERKVAYQGQDGSVYFAISQFPRYGRLSHLNLGSLQAGASQRVLLDEYDKDNVSDFVLWKAYDPARDGQIYWESPFGKGRPGWHIECSAMAMKLLGTTIDIHVGGVDNLFPHHENEIAQSEAYSCCRFVKHWLHSEHLLVDHKKMSKSLGNFYTLRDLLQKGFRGDAVRYLLMQTHYRTQQNFTFDALQAAATTLERLHVFVLRLKQLRREKMHSALEVILDQALPVGALHKEIKDRILVDVIGQKGRDIWDSHKMQPLLERGLPPSKDRPCVIQAILQGLKVEQQKAVLLPLLQKILTSPEAPRHALSEIVAQVQDEKECDILDPQSMRPVLERAWSHRADAQTLVTGVLSGLMLKKDRGFVLPLLVNTMQQFKAALADDLNISAALAAVFDMVREVNVLCDAQTLGVGEAEDVLDFLEQINQVLAVIPLDAEEEAIPLELEEALRERNRARAAKEWQLADACRAKIESSGYRIEDTPQGARLIAEKKK